MIALHLFMGIFLTLAAFGSMLSVRGAKGTISVITRIIFMIIHTILATVNFDIYLKSL